MENVKISVLHSIPFTFLSLLNCWVCSLLFPPFLIFFSPFVRITERLRTAKEGNNYIFLRVTVSKECLELSKVPRKDFARLPNLAH